MSQAKPVRTLNPEVARKIAAGEVIDRPNAIIRELMDNSIDAGASSITVEISSGGIDKIRINPGNIGSEDRVKAVADICRQKGLPIRIGVNSGSLEKEILAKYGSPTPEAMVESALYHASLLNKFDFDNQR